MPQEPTVGQVYFRVTYKDVKMTLPVVESLVYVGKNLSAQDTEDAWYFQFMDGYAEFGSIAETDAGDRSVYIVSAKDFDDMLSVSDLSKELEEAALRQTVFQKDSHIR